MLPESDIQQVISNILRREGTVSNDPADRGGETHYGITQPFAAQWQIPWPPSQQDARDGYRRMLAGTRIDQIPNSATLDLVADSAVNHDERRAIRWLQTALGFGIADTDGVIGAKTFAAIDVMAYWTPIRFIVLRQRIKFYGAIVANDPSQAKFLAGWLNRACEFIS